jgi:alkanesulfonate monooxygenase SsuD/methylene tetrahydromethanopterin reductase-like flavin-dependent oxidoreductase (luciferase family)
MPVLADGAGRRRRRLVNAGISIIPYADELPRIRELARAADTGGLRLVAIQDHPYQHHFLDAFALIATLLAATRRIGFVTDVANLPLRPPAVLARAAASLDAISGGRFELGLGGGAFAAGIAGLGAARRSPGRPSMRSRRGSRSSA